MSAPRFNADAIPHELRALDRWVWFELVRGSGGRWKKEPRIVGTSANASSTNPAHWSPFEAAAAWAIARDAWLGISLDRTTPYTCVDLDEVLIGADAAPIPEATALVDRLDTYTEISAGGYGLHVIAGGNIAQRVAKPGLPRGGRLEVFPEGGAHYVVMTGNLYQGRATIEDRSGVLNEIFPARDTTRDTTTGHDRPAGSSGPLTPAESESLTNALRALYVEGRRYHVALYSAGWFARQGVPRGQAEEIIGAIAAGDDDGGANSLRAVRDTYDDHEAGESVSGYRGLIDAGCTEAELAPAAAVLGGFWRRINVPPVLIIGDHREQGAPAMAHPARDTRHDTEIDDTGAVSLRVVTGDEPLERPAIIVGDRSMEDVTGEAWAALAAANDPAELFQYAGLPSRIERDDKDGPFAQALTPDRLRHEAARTAGWFRLRNVKEEGWRRVPVNPPMDTIRDMLAARRQDIPLPVLDGITEAPVFGPDGSLPDGEGYHRAGRMFYAPARGFTVPPIPPRPTAAEIEAARDLLTEHLLYDFPFTGQAERANTVALLLLPFLRGLIDGPTPLHLIEKPTAGTGASLLADVVARLATGRAVGAMTEGRDEDEWRKRLTSTLRAGRQIVMIDNLRGRLDSAALAAALTASHHEDRILGTSDMIRVPVRCVWLATGNNPGLSSEITRRTVRIRLNAKTDRPWERDPAGFKYPALLQWATEHRGELVAACLTLGRAWIAAGRPTAPGNPTLGSYEDWARVLGGVLDVAGVPGFLTNKSEFYDQSDTEGAAIRAFLGSWWAAHGSRTVGAAELFALASDPSSMLDLGSGTERSQRTRLGRLLGELRDRRYTIEAGRTVCILPGPVSHQAKTYRLQDEPEPDGVARTNAEPF